MKALDTSRTSLFAVAVCLSACVERSQIVNLELSARSTAADAGSSKTRAPDASATEDDQDAGPGGSSEKALLDTTQLIAGRPALEWIRRWAVWHVTMDSCTDNPLYDTTGALCAMHQERSASPVFFLETGEYPTLRDHCVIASDKALLVPLVYIFVDAIVPPFSQDVPVADTAARASRIMESMRDQRLELDGLHISAPDRFLAVAEKLTVEIPSSPNYFECFDYDDVEGPVEFSLAGYFAFLPPLEVGTHTVRYTGTLTEDGFDDVFDVTSVLTIE